MSAVRIPRMGGAGQRVPRRGGRRSDADRHHDGPRRAKAILAEAGRLGRPIVRIALTHAHGRTTSAGSTRWPRSCPGVEVLISARDAKLLAKDKSPTRASRRRKLRGGSPARGRSPRALLEPGDRVGSLEVIAAPGHTPATSRSSTPATAR